MLSDFWWAGQSFRTEGFPYSAESSLDMWVNLVLILRSSLGAQQPFSAHLLSLEEDIALGITVGKGGFDKVEEAHTKQTQDISVLCSSLFGLVFFSFGFFFLFLFS